MSLFNHRKTNEFLLWLNKSDFQPRLEIKDLTTWIEEQKLVNDEDRIWAVFLYTCVHNLPSARKLLAICGCWSTRQADFSEKIALIPIKCVNHRKYRNKKYVIKAIKDYDVLMGGSQLSFFKKAYSHGDPFDWAYQSIRNRIHSFGRLAVFDFLVRLVKLNILSNAFLPRCMYLKDATGPRWGLKELLLIHKPRDIDQAGTQLFKLVMGQTSKIKDLIDLEDALCRFHQTRKQRAYGSLSEITEGDSLPAVRSCRIDASSFPGLASSSGSV